MPFRAVEREIKVVQAQNAMQNGAANGAQQNGAAAGVQPGAV